MLANESGAMKTSYSNSSKIIRREKTKGYGNANRAPSVSKPDKKNRGCTFGPHLHTAIWGDLGDYILWRGRLLYVAIILYLVAVVKSKKWGWCPRARPLEVRSGVLWRLTLYYRQSNLGRVFLTRATFS